MSVPVDYQLPDGIQMPERFARRISFQIWFYEGVQAAVGGHPPRDEFKLRREKGKTIADAYQEGYRVGEEYVRQHLTEIMPKPTRGSKTQYENSKQTWFKLGFEDALKNIPPINETKLRSRYGKGAASEYKAGYELGKRGG